MSHHCNPFEFERLFQSYLAAFSLADQWQRADALTAFVTTLRRLGYVSVVRAEVSLKNNPMVEVRGLFSLAKRMPELVQIDLANVWTDATDASGHAYHAFEATPTGFAASLLAASDAIVVTYRLTVVGTH